MGFLGEGRKPFQWNRMLIRQLKNGQITERVTTHTFFMGQKSSPSKIVFFHIYEWRKVMI